MPILSDESLKRLKSYRWPGNLRELRNVLGSALATSQGPVLEIGEHLLDNSLRVGSYSLIERLGSGGMGEVWLARHQLLARPAAVKIVREAALGGGEDGHALRQRFAREAQATAELQSPHTVQLYDFGITDTRQLLLRDGAAARHGSAADGRTSRSAAAGAGRVPAQAGVPARCRRRTRWDWCIATSSRPISSSAGWDPEYDFLKVLDFGVVSRHATRAVGADHRRPEWFSARRRSSRPSWCRATGRSTDAPTSTRSAASPSGCSPAGRRSRPTMRCRC